MKTSGKLLLTLGLLTLTGCAATFGQTEEERRAAIAERLSTPAPPAAHEAIPPLPSAAEALLEPPPLMDDTQRPLDELRFDITADGVSVADFYHGLVEDTPYNVVVHPAVSGEVSLRLTDVSVPEVMEILRQGYGYHFQRTGSSYLVLPELLETRVFRLDYINVERDGLSGTRISGGEITSNEEDRSARRYNEINGSSLVTRSRSSLWADVESAIRQLIAGRTLLDDSRSQQVMALMDADGGNDNGNGQDTPRVVVSPEAGTVVVRATPDTLDEVETFMDGLQATLNRQVVLEARIVEVNLSDEFTAGIDWSRVGSVDGRQTTVDVSSPLAEDDTGLFELGILRGAEEPFGFDATIQALEEQGNVMVLSSPRVSTLNNQKALIKVGTDSFFQTGIDLDTTTTNGTQQTEVDPEFRSFFSGISLDVTPNIDSNGWVTLHVQPSVSSVSETPRTVERGDETVQFQLASSDVRQSDSIVRARNGDLIVIGGLMEERERSNDARVPGVGDIPPLDLLFGTQQQSAEKIELVILLRPTVVEEDTSWQRLIDEQLEQML
ncbi:pilus (MSHA type) biogenesis protein MshL [Spiribacter sp. 2438]|uniref:pilus (MSHA type) biogenesis protein MshL n=1 Tax=Spiribacter sp. 2438 TaxID=2666185 RepID=UPI0012AF9BF9|nr:pilus (MSHA type) biogenesis protein MshL [Spiribacter sp. 2438]QGM21540.1 pilus (MSHA type) biogenesis protein MshL [Spiribacter sp. 2438]